MKPQLKESKKTRTEFCASTHQNSTPARPVIHKTVDAGLLSDIVMIRGGQQVVVAATCKLQVIPD
jgi:hypothetical protein